MAAVFYKESFGGSGLLNGKAADVGFAGFTYANIFGGNIVQSGGFATLVASSAFAGLGDLDEPPPSVPATDITRFTCTFKWRSPPDLSAISGRQMVIEFRAKRPSDPTRLDVHSAIIEIYLGVVYLYPATRDFTSALTAVPGIVANTTYDVSFTLTNSNAVMSMNGVDAVSTPDPDRLCGPVCGVSIGLYSGNAVADISASGDSGPPPEPKWNLYRNTYELY